MDWLEARVYNAVRKTWEEAPVIARRVGPLESDDLFLMEEPDVAGMSGTPRVENVCQVVSTLQSLADAGRIGQRTIHGRTEYKKK